MQRHLAGMQQCNDAMSGGSPCAVASLRERRFVAFCTIVHMSHLDPLDRFLPAVSQWFRTALGEPTAPQQLGWPSIAAGNHTLILAPTGSGKTLAAFLACLDQLWREPPATPGVRVLYVS